MERRLFFYTILIFLLFSHLIGYSSNEDSLQIIELNEKGRNLARVDGDFDGAIDAFDQILLIDSNSVLARNNLGTVYKILGRYDDALNVLHEAADIVIRECGVDCASLSNIYTNLGNIYNLKRDSELALQYYNYTERVVQVNGLTNNTARSLYINIGNVYFYMRDWRKALASYMKGVETNFDNGVSSVLSKAYANCASSYENLEILDSAKMYYDLAIETKIAIYGPKNFNLISVYNNYSVLLQKLGDNESSMEYLQKALAVAEVDLPAKHPLRAECHNYMGSWHIDMDEPEQALEHYHKAITTVVFDYDNEDIYDSPSLENEIMSDAVLHDALIGKATALLNIYRQNYDKDALITSLQTLERSNLLTEKMRSTYQGQESKLYITETSHEGYSSAINIAYELYQLTGEGQYANKAFMYAEKSKSSVLLASLQEVETKKNLGIPAAIQSYEGDLKNEIEQYKKKLYEEDQREAPDETKLGLFQSKLISLSQELDSINFVIRRDFPEYATKYNNEVIDMAGVKEGLQANQVLLEYSFTDTSMFIFLIAKDKHLIKRITIDEDFNNDIDVLSQFLRNNDFANNTFEDYKSYTLAAFSLYSSLLLPLEDMIIDKNLIIIPDGELGYIPFEALLTSDPAGGGMDYRSLPYLIYKFSTNYSYSATIHYAEGIIDSRSEKQLLAFAPTYDHMEEIKEDKFPAYRDYSNMLVPLRFISQEIENISNIMDCDSYKSFEATEKVFREKAPDYDILHLAMHTLINDENPMYSQLVFTLNNDTLEDNDGLLNTYEIFNIELSARMAVLSACNTGYGKLRKGEGVMSLARGFIFAGVPSIIMTLWAVEDQSGSILMSKFYENLVDGQDIDAALRESKLQYLQTADQLSAHPYLWSGYVSIGSTRPLVKPANMTIYILGVGLGAILLSVILIRVRRKKKA